MGVSFRRERGVYTKKLGMNQIIKYKEIPKRHGNVGKVHVIINSLQTLWKILQP